MSKQHKNDKVPKTDIREKATSRSRLVPILSTFTYLSSTASENNKQSKPKEHKCFSLQQGQKESCNSDYGLG